MNCLLLPMISQWRDKRRQGLALAVLLALACGGATEPGPVVTGALAGEWQTASPASQGLDPGGVANAVAHARTLPRLLSLLVVRNGLLVVEQYFNGNRADSLNDGRSVTKSVVSTLVGAALHQGLLDRDALHDLIDRRPKGVELVLTGRNAPPDIIDKADLVTEMQAVKHDYQAGLPARDGIEK